MARIETTTHGVWERARRFRWGALVGAFALAAACGGSDDGGITSQPGTGGSGGGTAGTGGGTSGTGGGTSGTGATGGTGGGTAGTGAAGIGGGGTGGSPTACASDDDCAATPATPYCADATGTCVACEEGDPAHACPSGTACCGVACVDTGADPMHCGACNTPCNLANATAACSAGVCNIAACAGGFADCDGDVGNGCETPTAGGGCACTPGETLPCYTGAVGTENVGPCHGGMRTCNAAGSAFGPCVGEVIPATDTCLNNIDDDCDGLVNNGFPNGAACACIPGAAQPCYTGAAGTENVGTCHGGTAVCAPSGTGFGFCDGEVVPTNEVCANGLDEDCNGTADDSQDLDGDGWTPCQGDCCDQIGPACGSPSLVNPGAVEVQGDGVDNNCNGQVDENPISACSTGTKFAGTNAWDLLRAMEICATSSATSWGVVGTPQLTRANGAAATIDNRQISVMAQFGTDASNLPRFGPNFAVMSSGNARDANDPDATVLDSYSYVTGAPPPDFVGPHGGQLPATSASCPNGSGANDSVMLDVQLKVPTNANSFSFQFRFFSQEYWNWTCTVYNDFFVAMLNSTWLPQPGQTAIPADKNISFDANGNYISVNSQQFFTVCPPKAGYTCPDGQAGLAGTGYTLGPGGGTVWLTTTSPVVPGETIRLRFAIWDTSDALLDSIVLLDNFRWSATPSDGPITE